MALVYHHSNWYRKERSEVYTQCNWSTLWSSTYIRLYSRKKQFDINLANKHSKNNEVLPGVYSHNWYSFCLGIYHIVRFVDCVSNRLAPACFIFINYVLVGKSETPTNTLSIYNNLQLSIHQRWKGVYHIGKINFLPLKITFYVVLIQLCRWFDEASLMVFKATDAMIFVATKVRKNTIQRLLPFYYQSNPIPISTFINNAPKNDTNYSTGIFGYIQVITPMTVNPTKCEWCRSGFRAMISCWCQYVYMSCVNVVLTTFPMGFPLTNTSF